MTTSQKQTRQPGGVRKSVLTGWLLIMTCATAGWTEPAHAGKPRFKLEVEQLTSGPKHHFFGYIGQCQTIPWNASGRYILGLEIDRIDRMPRPEESATVILIDTRDHNRILRVDKTHAWNPQQGTMFYWNPLDPETQFFFNDRDVESGKVFVVLYDVKKKERIREYRYADTPIGNGGIAPDGSSFLALNYGRLARLRLVTGYPEALDWSRDETAPGNDGLFSVDIKTGKKRLLVSYRQLEEKLKEHNPDLHHSGLFINHTLWNRDTDRIYFFARSGWGDTGGDKVNRPFSVHADGTGLTLHEKHIGGHPEWAEGSLVIGIEKGRASKPDQQILYNIDTKKIVGQLGTPEMFPRPEGDIALSSDGNWFVNGYKQGNRNYYSVYRRSDGAFVRSGGIDKGSYSGDIRIDPAPRWNRSNDAILIPGIARDKTRQMSVIRITERSETASSNASTAAADHATLFPITNFQGNPSLSSADVVRDALDGGSFHPTGNRVAVSDNATTVRIFDLGSRSECPTVLKTFTHDSGFKYGNPATRSQDSDGECNCVSFTSDGHWMLTGINDHGVRIWNVKTGAQSQHLDRRSSVDGAAFSKDDQFVGVGAFSLLKVYRFNASTGKADIMPVMTSDFGAGEINAVDFSDDGKYVVAVGGVGSGQVRIFNTGDWSLQSEYVNPGPGNVSIKSVMFSPDSQLVAYGARQGRVRIVDLDGNLVTTLRHSSDHTFYKYDDNDRSAGVESLDWTADGNYLITGGLIDGIARVWHRRNWSLVGWVRGQDPGPDSRRKQPRGRAIELVRIDRRNRVLLAGDEGVARLYQFNTPTQKGPFIQENRRVPISIEVENFDTNLGQGFIRGTTTHQRWVPVNHADASGGTGLTVADAGMQHDADYQTYDPTGDAPRLDYIVKFSKTGTYYIWVRGKGGNDDNSIHVGLDGTMVRDGEKLQFGDDGSVDWVWSHRNREGRAAKLMIDVIGEHTINLWMREDGVSIDKLILSSDETFDPAEINSGLGSPETSRAAVSAGAVEN